MRRVGWRTAVTPSAHIPDLGPARLDTLAHAFACRTQTVLRHGLSVSYGESNRRTKPELHPSDRVWRSGLETAVVWCAIDAPSHCALLEWILNGPGATVPTAAERTIISECVERLFSSSVESCWRESVGEIGLPVDVWERILDISGEGACASIKLYTGARADSQSTHALELNGVTIDLKAQLQPFAMRFNSLLAWEPGAIVRLQDVADSIPALVRVAGGPVVFGTLGRADGCRAIRLNRDPARNGAP